MKLKNLTAHFLAGFFLLSPLACEELDESEDVEETTGDTVWEDIHECDSDMWQYIDTSVCLVGKHYNSIIERIDEDFPEEYQIIQPEVVLDAVMSGKYPITCGTPTEENIFAATWSNSREAVTLNEPYYQEKYETYYAPNTSFLDGDCDIDWELAEEHMLNHEDLFTGFQEVYNSFKNIYINAVGYGLGSTIVHEDTHAVWFDASLNNHHQNPIEFETDPYYQYGFGVYELSTIFYGEVGKEIVDLREKLEE
ncbi:MAG: hypothetical protein ABIF40_04290 [archaeon]